MSNSSFSFYSNVFGIIVGGISLLGCVVAMCRPHLPSNKIKTLETLLFETEDAFREAVEAGLLVEVFIERTEHRLTILRERTCSLRSRAYNATTLRKNYTELFSGTSIAIGSACQSLKNLRADIITSSEERRHRLRTQMNSAPQQASLAALSLSASFTVEHLPLHVSSVDTSRPRSCPPSLPAGRLRDVRNLRVEGNHSGTPRGNSDVWTTDVQI